MSASSNFPRRKKLVPLPVNTQREELARAQRWYQVTAPKLNRLYDRERRALVQAKLVLDVGCGAGLWCVDQARAHPSSTYFGIDLDRHQIALATMHAEVEFARNALFSRQDMNNLDPQSFHPDTFGFIHIAQIAQALLSSDYQRLASTMYQLLQPGGILTWTEAEFPLTTSKALDTIISLVCEALDEAGHRFTPHTRFEEIMAEQREQCGLPEPHRRNLQITAWMPYWLGEAGFVEMDEVGHLFSLQAGTELHAAFVEQVDDALTRIRPFLLRHRVLDGRRIDALYERALKEMRRPDFSGLLSAVTLCARKPDPRPHQGQQEESCAELANGNRSEVARLREQIEAEYEAARLALYGLAQGTARHDIISAHMANAQQYGQQLIDRIGKDEALPIIVRALDEAVQEK